MPALAGASLPDNRIYEEVSPSNKDGNAIIPTAIFPFEWGVGLAAGDGNAVAFQTTGGVGKETNQGGIQEDIARHVSGQGWSTEPADARQLGQLGLVASPEVPGFYPSSNDFSHIFFDPTGCCASNQVAYSPEEPATGVDLKLYLNENPLAPPTWVGKPLIANPIPMPNTAMPDWSVAGVAQEGTMYFNYSGTLLPEDSVREAHVGNGLGNNAEGGGVSTSKDAWGFYEWNKGGVSEAGVRPDGTLSPWGAISAAVAPDFRGNTAKNNEKGPLTEELNNEVSQLGSRAFFVSPDPQVEQVEGSPAKPVANPEPPELYMREALANGEHRSVLVSRSEIASEEQKPGADPAKEGAPAGVGSFEDAAAAEYGTDSTDVFASPDGSHVFFASSDALLRAVPLHSEYHLYMGYWEGGHFKLEVTANGTTQTTTALPWRASDAEVQSALAALSNVGAGNVEVEGPPPQEYEPNYILKFPNMQVANVVIDGAGLNGNSGYASYNTTPPNVYEFDVATEKLIYLPELAGARFAAASIDGSQVMFLSPNGDLDLLTGGVEAPKVEAIVSKFDSSVTPARAAANGSAFLFYASSYSGGPLSEFNNGGYSQFYHYDVANKELVCVSCPPAGIYPSGPAETNYDSRPEAVQPVRMMSEDGTRVFFQSPDPLIGADVNGQRDVYEWENGHLYLISAGNSTVPSFYIDNSSNGGDVFFATPQGLIPSDKDEQVDVYDARIPRPGDNPPPKQTPCSGEVCQGPPSVPELLTPAASATFEGLGNIPPEVVPPEKEKPKPAVKCKKGRVKKNGKCVKKKASKKRKKAKKGKKSAAGNGRRK